MPRHRINGIYPVAPVVAIMIGNEARPTVSINGPVEIVENEESGEPKPRVPERVRDPGIHVGIIRRGRVISDDRRPLIIIVVVDCVRV
jgi:hypothetical protein